MLFKRTLKQSSQAASSHDGHEHHIMPLKVYYAVFSVLLVLTIVTVLVSHAALPAPWAIVVALVVATIKAALVAGYFMHLKYDTKFNVFVFLSSLFFLVLFFAFTLVDLSGRGLMAPEESEQNYLYGTGNTKPR